jgi:hypothetical protein
MSEPKRRRPVPDRARKRAIRAYALQAGVSYSVAARHLDLSAAVDIPASRGRTVYPPGSDEHRRWLIAARERRSYDLRVRDTRRATDLPIGRAGHLVERFPSLRGEPASGVDLLYCGDSRAAAIALLYTVVGHERPDLLPLASELTWMAELGEESAVDLASAGIDRAARAVLDDDRWSMWTRVESAVAAGQRSSDRSRTSAARELAAELRTLSLRSSVDGARHTLDALLVCGEDGHAPGTRVRILPRPYRGRLATIVGARWASTGAPVGYDVRPDADPTTLIVAPDDLTLLGTSPAPSPV